MVHKIYFYDSKVGTGRVLEYAFPFEEEVSFNVSIDDFKSSLSYFLSNYHFIVLSPEDVTDETYMNIVVDCSESTLSYIVEYAEVFFKIRGFKG